jgi:hypothetical protein
VKEYIRAWWAAQESQIEKPLKKPMDLLNRPLSNSEYLDAAVIGGIELKDIIAGKIAESRIPSDVVRAFHEQYPNVHVDLVAEVRRLSGQPEQLRGLISGIKGKLFEDQYISWLDHGHLPSGYRAELAHHANNPTWDIVIKDSHGHVDNLLQLKATESADYVRHALDAHPHIDVVATHEVFSRLSDHHSDLAHLIDSGITNASLSDHTAGAVEHADAASHLAFHLPLLAVGVAVVMELQRYRTGRQSLSEAIRQMSKRSLVALVATTAGWIAVATTGKTVVGLPAAVLSRIAAGSVAESFELRVLLRQSIEQARQSSARLAAI